MDDDEDDDIGQYIVQPHKASLWVVLSAALEWVENVLEAGATFFSALSCVSLAHYRHVEQQQVMHDQATAEIEMLTRGD